MVRLTVVIALVALVVGCQQPNEPVDGVLTGPNMTGVPTGFVPHATGEIEFEWKGGNGSGSPEITKYAFASLEAHMAGFGKPAKGEFRFWVQSLNELNEVRVHRQIVAEVSEVNIGEYYPLKAGCDGQVGEMKVLAWFKATVVSDSKGCSGGGGPGGHEPGCPGSTEGGGCEDETDGGCADDGGHDEGCSGSGGSDMGGSEGEGGCSGHDGTDGSGCSGHDGTDGSGCSGHEGSEGSGSSGHEGPGGSTSHGNPVSGRYCRVGQIVVVKVHDGGTPGTNGDGIKWKWFAPGSMGAEDPLPVAGPEGFVEPKLCKKTILEGNLFVHLTPETETPLTAAQ